MLSRTAKFSLVMIKPLEFVIRLLPGGTSGKEPANAGDMKDENLIPELGRSPRGDLLEEIP